MSAETLKSLRNAAVLIVGLLAAWQALAMFAGPHAYISPSWYETGPAVPTWNYASVHAYGPAQRIDDPEWLRGLVRRLSERHEAREPTPWRMEDLPEPYVQAMLTGIIGVELAVARLEGKFKLSQNRPAGAMLPDPVHPASVIPTPKPRDLENVRGRVAQWFTHG